MGNILETTQPFSIVQSTMTFLPIPVLLFTASTESLLHGKGATIQQNALKIKKRLRNIYCQKRLGSYCLTLTKAHAYGVEEYSETKRKATLPDQVQKRKN